ncbi:polysaccharide pyruvyl transferase CsaB [Paenibacillus beijingensis]|uniref:Polysaccharide pyruvyl transferase n=1 Tax=Paenibacillus beijingensis TaxID=1126833 RepID=A0A0D5NHC8_9BACL|nr:polysaccharide pyruvyl transferase CsaB [Paenibacillus beijingensis]AJY74540.1 polysaccharide pyruvyl transferase [Paenibacillus beijingensis]
MEARSEVRRIAISGYYGFRNSGDEAVLKSILLALEEEGREQGIRIEPVVLSSDPDWTSRMYGVEAAHRMRPAELLGAIRSCDGLISGGGSLLQDATGGMTIPYYTGVMKLAQLLGKPTFVYSQGVGPVNSRRMDPLIRHVMRRSAYVSVRDAESAQLLGRIGVPADRIEIVPDPVMGLPLPDEAAAAGAAPRGDAGAAESGAAAGSEAPAAGGGAQPGGPGARAAGAAAPDARPAAVPLVGVSLRHWRKDGADLARAAEALAALARRRAVRLRFLPFHSPGDAEASRQVMERLEALGAGGCSELAAPGHDPRQMLAEVSRCDLLFGMRLHALIYAANQSVPMIGLSYDPKIDAFLQRLGERPAGTTESLAAEPFADAAERLLDSGEEWRAVHAPAIAELKREARRPAQQIVQYLRHRTTR